MKDQDWIDLKTWKPLTSPRPVSRLARAIVVRALVRMAFRVDHKLARNLCGWLVE